MQLLALGLIWWSLKSGLKKKSIPPEISEKIWNITVVVTLVVLVIIGITTSILSQLKTNVDLVQNTPSEHTSSWVEVENTAQNSIWMVSNSWIDSTDFNTKPTKLIDLSLYDLEKSKKLWSEASYFVFDGKWWLAQAPLVKLGENEWKIVTGIANNESREDTDWSYTSISANGKFGLISKTIDSKDGSGTIEQKLEVRNITTGSTFFSSDR